MKKITFSLILIIAFLNIGSAQKGKYKQVVQTNTIEAYEAFILKYPKSQYKGDVYDKLILLEYNKAIEINTTDAYRMFLYKYGNFNQYEANSDMIAEFEERIKGLEIDKVMKSETIDDYDKLKKKYPKLKDNEEFKERLMFLEYKKAKASNSVSILRNFIRSYPKSKYTHEIEEQMQEIEEQMIDLQYKQACIKNTTKGYESFLAIHSKSKYTAEVKDRIGILAYERACESKTISDLQSFITFNPKSKHVEDARKKIGELEFKNVENSRPADSIVQYVILYHKYPETGGSKRVEPFIKEYLSKAALFEIEENPYGDMVNGYCLKNGENPITGEYSKLYNKAPFNWRKIVTQVGASGIEYLEVNYQGDLKYVKPQSIISAKQIYSIIKFMPQVNEVYLSVYTSDSNHNTNWYTYQIPLAEAIEKIIAELFKRNIKVIPHGGGLSTHLSERK